MHRLSPHPARLFADDFSLSLQFSNPSNRAARLLQQALNIESAWATESGLRLFLNISPTLE